VRRMIGLPAIGRSVAFAVSLSGPLTVEGSGVPFGQSGSVTRWARAPVATVKRAIAIQRWVRTEGFYPIGEGSASLGGQSGGIHYGSS
jgi:hypothetical protein